MVALHRLGWLTGCRPNLGTSPHRRLGCPESSAQRSSQTLRLRAQEDLSESCEAQGFRTFAPKEKGIETPYETNAFKSSRSWCRSTISTRSLVINDICESLPAVQFPDDFGRSLCQVGAPIEAVRPLNEGEITYVNAIGLRGSPCGPGPMEPWSWVEPPPWVEPPLVAR